MSYFFLNGNRATGPFYSYPIDNSLRFDGSSGLYRTPGTTGDDKKFTLSAWVKRTKTGVVDTLFSAGVLDDRLAVYFDTDDCLHVQRRNGSARYIHKTVQQFRDVSSWYHIAYVVDTTLATDSDRVKIYVNGVRVSTEPRSGYSYVPQNTGMRFNVASVTTYIGLFVDFGSLQSTSYIAAPYLLDGVTVGETGGYLDEFGELKSGIWVPKEYTGNHGTNGFHLDFADGTSAAALGYDAAGSNDFTPSGIATSDQMLDSPTNNCCVLNPLDPGTTGTLSEGNLVTSGNAKVTMRPTTGHWYYEKDGVGNTWDTSTSGEFNPTLAAGTYNFGQRPWADTGPTGSQKALVLDNLPAPTFDPEVGASPQDAFNVYTDTGANIKSTAQSDYADGLFWIKDYQTPSTDHQLLNTVTNTVLESNTADAERSYSDPSGSSMAVAWAWKGGGSSSIFNIDGTGYSTATEAGLVDGDHYPTGATVNTQAGVGIYTYTGDGTVKTVAHGLGVAPSVVLLKNVTNSSNWIFYTNTVDGTMDYTVFNATNAFAASGRNLTSTTFDHGGDTNQGAASNNYIAWVFAEKEGFSKFGAYAGNGSTDGPFIYTGFKPAFVLIKEAVGAGGDWAMYDSARNPYNVADEKLRANTNGAETVNAADALDFTSNGMKLRNNGSAFNASGDTYFYMAFAEQPFKYANAR